MAIGFGGRFYAVGKKGSGVVLVFFDPMKVYTIPHEHIVKFAFAVGITTDDLFFEISKACCAIAREFDVTNPLTEKENASFLDGVDDLGMSFSNTEFAVSGEVDLSKHLDHTSITILRKSTALLHNAFNGIKDLSNAITKDPSLAQSPAEIIGLAATSP